MIDLVFEEPWRIDQVEDEGPTPEELVEQRWLAKNVYEILSTMDARIARILRLRYGIGCVGHTLEEVGEILGVTRERVRALQAKGIRMLQHGKRCKRFRQHLDEWSPPLTEQERAVIRRLAVVEAKPERRLTREQEILLGFESFGARGIANYAMTEGKCRVLVEYVQGYIGEIIRNPYFVVTQQGEWYEVTVHSPAKPAKP